MVLAVAQAARAVSGVGKLTTKKRVKPPASRNAKVLAKPRKPSA
jgi:hypothetical protein